MNRSQFLGLLTLPFLTRFVKEDKYNSTRPPYEIDEVCCIRKYPLTPEECFRIIPDARNGDIVVDENRNVFYCVVNVDKPVKLLPLDCTSEKVAGYQFAVIRRSFREDSI